MAFDLADYKARTERLDVSGVDFEAFRNDPLDSGALRCLRYMHDVEYHTICYLRDLLLTPAHHDPEVTTFLSFWAYEELWHGEAIASVLAAHEEPAGLDCVGDLRARLGARDAARPLLMTIGGWIGKEDFVATHMTWGAINEWTTQAGYSLLARKAKHPVLSELLRRPSAAESCRSPRPTSSPATSWVTSPASRRCGASTGGLTGCRGSLGSGSWRRRSTPRLHDD